eukprot:TRINITY_DN3082_c0_g1_i2.p1 TRINITY_DN3082_c0_g1~~TRINITY_DN3082_c0_g1_i2.p1  ORF type:complete len:412 (+),score=71.26 TRINITY_DN3082_c0_g1_i2:148-1383(+)
MFLAHTRKVTSRVAQKRTHTKQALSHLRVLDLSRVLAGPWATQCLADMGAQVIKIESKSGDDTRHWGPPFLQGGESSYFISTNRGKKSVVVDIRSPKGQAIIHDLVLHSHVVIQNFKVGGLKKYNLDYESMKKINPGIIYCSISGFGQTGEMKNEPGYDFIAQGMGGLMSITGEPNGDPMKVGVAVTDILTVSHQQATQSKEGQHIDLSLFDTQIAMLGYRAQDCLLDGQVPKRYGNAHPTIVPYSTFECSDGHIIVGVGNDTQFAQFCEVIQLSELSTDPKFSTNPERVKHRSELISIIEEKLKTNTRSYWLQKIDETGGIPHSSINNIKEVMELPTVKEREMVVTLPHPHEENLKMIGNPIKMSETKTEYKQPPPLLGQHTREVLADILGYDQEKIGALNREGVIKIHE